MARRPKEDPRELARANLKLLLQSGLDPSEVRGVLDEVAAGDETPTTEPRGRFRNQEHVNETIRGKPRNPMADKLNGLNLDHPRPRVAYWFYRWTHEGKTRRVDIGLAYGDDKITLDQAREVAARMHKATRGGRDPKEELQKWRQEREPQPQPQTDKTTNSYHAAWEAHRYDKLKDLDPEVLKKKDQDHEWYIKPAIGNMDVAVIGMNDVDEVVWPLFNEIEPDTVIASIAPSSTVGMVDAARLTGKAEVTIQMAMKRGRLAYTRDEKTGSRRIELKDLEKVYPLVIPDDGKRVRPGQPTRSGYGARRGRRVLDQISVVMGSAMARDMRPRSSGNPASWEDIFRHIYAADKTPKEHYPSIPWRRIPELFVNLHAVQRREFLVDENPHLPLALAQLAEATALNIGRGKEYRECRWPWIDFEAEEMVVPGKFMKQGMPHRKPLCKRLMQIFRDRYADRKPTDNNLCFPCREDQPSGNPRMKPVPRKVARPFTDTVVLKLVKRCCPSGSLGPKMQSVELAPLVGGSAPVTISVEAAESLEATVHGLRASFSTWAGENKQDRDARELNLAHKIMSDTAEAYCRTDFMQDRREVNDAWSAHCLSLPDSMFVPPTPHVRHHQPVIDEAWRILLAKEASNHLHAARLAVSRFPEIPTTEAAVYQQMRYRPRKDAPPPKHVEWNASHYAEEVAQLLAEATHDQAVRIVADRYGKQVYTCECCGESFVPGRVNTKYCSTRCGHRHQQAESKRRRLAEAAD